MFYVLENRSLRSSEVSEVMLMERRVHVYECPAEKIGIPKMVSKINEEYPAAAWILSSQYQPMPYLTLRFFSSKIRTLLDKGCEVGVDSQCFVHLKEAF